MKISIPIKCDSDNSYPKEDLELTVTGVNNPGINSGA